MSSTIEGKVVVITGASSGLGEAKESARKLTDEMAFPAETFARMVAFAMSQP